jgi:hypothetical protein
MNIKTSMKSRYQFTIASNLLNTNVKRREGTLSLKYNISLKFQKKHTESCVTFGDYETKYQDIRNQRSYTQRESAHVLDKL